MLTFHVFTDLSQKKFNNYLPLLLSGKFESKDKQREASQKFPAEVTQLCFKHHPPGK